MASGMRYLVRTADGNEYGPVDQEALIQWAQSGRLTPECEVRNAMMTKWNSADKVPFVKDIIKKQVASQGEDVSLKSKFSNVVNKGAGATTQPGHKVKLAAGPIGLRFSAWLFDALILAGVGCGLLAATSAAITGGVSQEAAFTGLTLVYVLCILMYYTISMGFKAQSIGQMFWGIMVVRPDGEPVLMGRAFVYSVFYLLFFWSTLFFTFCLPSKRALQDILSGVRIVRISSAGG